MTTERTRGEVSLDEPPDAEVLCRLDEYRWAGARLREFEHARALGGPVDAPAHLAAAQAVLDTRLALFRCLMGHGWTPPDDVLADIVRDEALARESTGAAG